MHNVLANRHEHRHGANAGEPATELKELHKMRCVTNSKLDFEMEDPGVRCPRCNYKTHGKGATQKWSLISAGRCPAQDRICKACGKTGHLTNARSCRGKKNAIRIVGKQRQRHKASNTNIIVATATVTNTKAHGNW